MKSLFDAIELYAPGHFGNSYEVAGTVEMRAILDAAHAWGFNRYGDWFDMDDCRDPFADRHTYGLGLALWESKKLHYSAAAAADLGRTFLMTPNHVYVDQCLPDRCAVKGDCVFG